MTGLPSALAGATATYRLQLRGEMGFAEACDFVPYLSGLGVSHLYLSPIFTATSGSTHGYDVTRPDAIDPALGGRAGFEALAAAARAAGLGIILDIVPNHTAFSLENPWLRDVLRHGAASRYAGHFDIDFRKPLLLPFLPDAFAAVAEADEARVVVGKQGDVLEFAGLSLPLAPGTAQPGPLGPEALQALHRQQHWRLAFWELERDLITHRRFFNVTQLIGMRVEEPQVFDDMHALVVDLVRAGLVQGLRVDHIDGLADPARYLDRLAAAVPGCPVWVEKILTGDEALPADWPVVGTTGYEAAVAMGAVLADRAGVDRLTLMWRQATGGATGGAGSFHDALERAKLEVIQGDLAAELWQLVELAGAVVEAETALEAGPETLREAMLALLVEMPRYRTYFTPGYALGKDVALWQAVVDRAAQRLRGDRALRLLGEAIRDGAGPEAARLQARFQQVTGALLAKSHEDTAFFRHVPYLAANEVGGDPDRPSLTVAEFDAFCRARLAVQPAGLTLTSTHDTKRAEDARMRLAAMGHLPDAFAELWADAARVPGFGAIPASVAWYAVQSAVAIWEEGRDDLGPRLAAHVEKALREGKEITNWTHPVEEAEAPARAFAEALIAAWTATRPPGLADLVARGDSLSLCLLALKLAMPGIPDIYRGTEGPAHWLTDPDNRLHVGLDEVTALPGKGGLGAQKAELLRALLQLRAADPDGFLAAEVSVEPLPDGLALVRSTPGWELRLDLRPKAALDDAVRLMVQQQPVQVRA